MDVSIPARGMNGIERRCCLLVHDVDGGVMDAAIVQLALSLVKSRGRLPIEVGVFPVCRVEVAREVMQQEQLSRSD